MDRHSHLDCFTINISTSKDVLKHLPQILINGDFSGLAYSVLCVNAVHTFCFPWVDFKFMLLAVSGQAGFTGLPAQGRDFARLQSRNPHCKVQSSLSPGSARRVAQPHCKGGTSLPSVTFR